MYTVIGNWYVRDGKATEAHRALRDLADQVKSEERTFAYLVHEPTASLPPAAPHTIVFIEIYPDEAAFQAYITGPVFTNFMATHKDLFVSDPQGNAFIEYAHLHRLAGFVRAAAATQ